MELGEPDASGRRRPIPVAGELFEFPVDTVIPAIGQAVNVDFIEEQALRVDPRTCATQIPHIYAGGDAVRGASSVINAIGDGQIAAKHILRTLEIEDRVSHEETQQDTLGTRLPEALEGEAQTPRVISIEDLKQKAAIREYGIEPPPAPLNLSVAFPLVQRTLTEEEAVAEASRCLLCDDYCSVCVGVCPNLANLTYTARAVEYPVQEASFKAGKLDIRDAGIFTVTQGPQVLNIGDLCNECGNCTTFCPTAGEPYKDKPQIHISEQSYREAEMGYRLLGNTLHFKSGEYQSVLTYHEGDYLYHSAIAQVRFSGATKIVDSFNLEPKAKYFSTLEALEMIVLFESLQDNPVFG
jgi:putative selenate reductase